LIMETDCMLVSMSSILLHNLSNAVTLVSFIVISNSEEVIIKLFGRLFYGTI
jgi:hypothetical protein